VPKKRIGIGRDQTPTPAGRKPQGALKKTTVKPRDTAEQSGNCGLRCRARLSGMARVPASTSGLGDELRGELFDAANGDPTSGIGRADDGGEIPHKPKRPAAAIALASICSAGRDRTGSPGSRFGRVHKVSLREPQPSAAAAIRNFVAKATPTPVFPRVFR
jgi:hypothetical protein